MLCEDYNNKNNLTRRFPKSSLSSLETETKNTNNFESKSNLKSNEK